MATRPKAVIESRNGEKFSPITITKNVLTDDGQNLYDILDEIDEYKYSRIPVYEESIDNIKGILFLKDVLKLVDGKFVLDKETEVSRKESLRERLNRLKNRSC